MALYLFRRGSFTDNDAHVQEAYYYGLRFQVPSVDEVDVVGLVARDVVAK